MFFQSLLPSFNLNNIAAVHQQPDAAAEAGAAAPEIVGFPQRQLNAQGDAEG